YIVDFPSHRRDVRDSRANSIVSVEQGHPFFSSSDQYCSGINRAKKSPASLGQTLLVFNRNPGCVRRFLIVRSDDRNRLIVNKASHFGIEANDQASFMSRLERLCQQAGRKQPLTIVR